MKRDCIIIDDEPLAIRLLQSHVAQVPELRLIGSFENPLEALAFLRQHPVELLFLDIQMPVITGIEFLKSVQPSSAVIFTTAYRDYAVESYELAAVDYLLKPITFSRFYQAVNKFLGDSPVHHHQGSRSGKTRGSANSIPNDQGDQSSPTRFFNVNKKQVKVTLAAITYIESLKDYICIRTHEQELITKERISDIVTELPKSFLRVHRSFIVNLDQVTAFTAHYLEIGDIEIPIGVSFKQLVLQRLTSDT